MDMNTAFFLRKEDAKPRWLLVDAKGKTLGRLATQIAHALRGKDQAHYTPHADGGDYVIVINADHIVLTGNKWDEVFTRYSGYIGGQKETKKHEMKKKHPAFIVTHAVKGMLPKNKQSNELIKKLKVYAGAQHEHAAQKPVAVDLV
jgi:large subunit ribosomal protein L13